MTRSAYQQFVAKADEQADDGDFNSACSMVYRWWSLLEAPAGTDTSKFLEGLVDTSISVQMPDLGIDISGSAATASMLAVGLRNGRPSYSVRDDAFEVSYLGDGVYRLQAAFAWHSQTAEGRSVGGQGQCDHLLRKIGPARMVFTRIREQRGDSLERAGFESSYRLHRIKSVLLQWQANMDTLNGDSSGLKELVMPEMEFHGLISAKLDHSERRDGVVTDFTEMKGMLAGTDGKEETVIRGFDGVTKWFATGPSLLKRNIHRAERFEITPLEHDRYGVIAQFGWYAQTLNGVEIELHQPLEWTIVERGEKYMRLEKLHPHAMPPG
jgi:hypothetical protein